MKTLFALVAPVALAGLLVAWPGARAESKSAPDEKKPGTKPGADPTSADTKH